METTMAPMKSHALGSCTTLREVNIIGVMTKAPKETALQAPEARDVSTTQRRSRMFMQSVAWA